MLEAIVTNGREPYQITWEDGQMGLSIYSSFNESTTVNVSIEDGCDNETSGEVNVTVPVYNLQLSTIEDSTICELSEIFMFASAYGGAGEYTYQWTGHDIVAGANTDTMHVNSTTSIENPADSILFDYVIKSTDQCDNETERIVELWVRDCELIAPGIFTPNSDNVNDAFEITSIDYYPNSTLTVYDRWGRLVFESENYQNEWDGDKRESGVYYYMLNPSDPDIEPLAGYVHLVREN